MPTKEEDVEADGPPCDAKWSCVAAMLGGSKEGTLKPGAPMVKGSKDSADESESFINLDSSELKRESESGAADVDVEDEGSRKLRLPL